MEKPDYIEPYQELDATYKIRKLGAVLLIILFVLFFLIGLYFLIENQLISGIVVMLPCFFWPFWVNLARILWIPVNRVCWENDKPIILRLRSFSSDFGPYDDEPSLSNYIFSGEEQYLDVLHEFGYCIAVGRPNETIPAFGFDRWKICKDVDWQEAVIDLIRSASLIVCGPGSTDNYLWELKTAFKEKEPRQIIVFWTENNNILQKEILEILSPEGTKIEMILTLLIASSIFPAKLRIVIKEHPDTMPIFDLPSNFPTLATKAGLISQWPKPLSIKRKLILWVDPIFKIIFSKERFIIEFIIMILVVIVILVRSC